MKNKIKYVAVVVALVFAAMTVVSGRRVAAEGAVSDGVASLSTSKALYNANCASCHGRDGKANTAKGRELDADDISGGTSTAKTIRIVTSGKGDMPAFRKKLSKAQIASIAAYVKTL